MSDQIGLGLGEQPRKSPRAATVTSSERVHAELLLDACEAFVATTRATARAAAIETVASVLASVIETAVSCAVVRAEREREAAGAARRKKGAKR